MRGGGTGVCHSRGTGCCEQQSCGFVISLGLNCLGRGLLGMIDDFYLGGYSMLYKADGR